MALFSRSLNTAGENGSPAVNGEGETSPRNTIGDLLRQTRQGYGGEIDRIAGTLRIRAAYLTAIEDSQYDRLPGPVYAQGFVRAYAVHLGLDGDEAIRRFKQEMAGFEVSRDLSFPMPLGERSIPGGTMVLAALILAICGYGLWYYVSTSDRAHPERVSAVPPDLMAASPPPPVLPSGPAGGGTAGDSPATSSASDTVVSAPTAAPFTSVAAASPAVAPPIAPSSAVPAPSAITASGAPPQLPKSTSTPASPPASLPVSSSVLASQGPQTAAVPPAAMASAAPAPAITLPAAVSATDAAGPAQSHAYGAPANIRARIIVHAVKESWVQVNNGGQILTERILHPGDTVRIPDQPGLTLRTGNGAGIALEIDGKLGKPLSGTVRTIALNPDQLSGRTTQASHTPQSN